MLSRNHIFAWIALVTLLLLIIPLVAMQFTDQVNWDGRDFLMMGILLFGTGSLFVPAARRLPRKHRFTTGVLFVVVLLYIWAELAVGIFTEAGN